MLGNVSGAWQVRLISGKRQNHCWQREMAGGWRREGKWVEEREVRGWGAGFPKLHPFLILPKGTPKTRWWLYARLLTDQLTEIIFINELLGTESFCVAMFCIKLLKITNKSHISGLVAYLATAETMTKANLNT